MNMITRSSHTKQSIGVIPNRTAWIMAPTVFAPLGGNSETITNISLMTKKRRITRSTKTETRKPAKFFLKICNLLRKQAGHPPLECIFFNPDKEERFEQEKGEKFPFIHFRGDIPKSIQEHSEGGYLVSPELRSIIESKVNTARAGEILSNPTQRLKAIVEFLKIKRMNKAKIVKELDAAVVRSIIPTGVVQPETYEDAIKQMKKLLQNYKKTGIVFQFNQGSGGVGTALLTPEKIKDILKDPNAKLLNVILRMMNYRFVSEEDYSQYIFQTIKEEGLPWQKMVSGQEVGVTFRTNSETKQIEISAAAKTFVSQEGKYLGSNIIDIADIQFTKEQEKYFTLSSELMLHTILKLNGYKKGINEIYDADGLHLKAFSNDTFFSVADDGSIKHEISEFNARPPSSAQAIVSAEAIGVTPPFERFWTSDVPMPKDVFEHLQKLDVEKASDFFSKKFTPILKKFKGAFIDTCAVFDNSYRNNPKDHFSYSWSLFCPHPDMENKGQEGLKAMKDIQEICKNITTHDIDATLSLRRSKRLRTI